MTDEGVLLDAQRLIGLRRLNTLAVSPCGTWAAVAVERLDEDRSKYVSDLWRVPLDGGAPSQLTRGAHSDTAPRFRRNGDLGFLSNRPLGEKPADGEEDRRQLWVLPATGGEPQPVTDEPLGVTAFRFAARGDRLVCVAPVLPDVDREKQRDIWEERKKHGPSSLRYSEQPIRFWDHWLPATAPHIIAFDEHGARRADLTPEATVEHRQVELDLSPDGNLVAVTTRSLNDRRLVDVHLLLIALDSLDRPSDDGEPVSASLPRAVLGESGEMLESPLFSPDGRHLVCSRGKLSPERVGRTTLRLYDLEGVGLSSDALGDVAARGLVGDWDRWPTPADWTPDSKQLLAIADDEGAVPVFAVDLESDTVQRLTAVSAGGSHASVAALPSGDSVVGLRSTAMHPPEVFALDFGDGAAGEPRLLTALSGFSADEGRSIAATRELDVTSTDGARVQCTVLEPAGSDAPHPGLLWIHGGPMGAWSDGWHWRWNPLLPVAAGYTVALPNPRGSTGFGQDFIEGIWGNVWGAQCYEDVIAATDALEADEAVDGARVAAMGGSFGGYMTNWLGANTDRFACLITHASVFSMSIFYGDTDLPAFWALFMGDYPYADREAFDRYSPSQHLDSWTTPTLIIHGERDYRVPVSQALHLFEGLRYHEVDCELLVFPDENHWILRPRNVVAWYEAVLEYLGRYLEPGSD